MLHGNNLCLEDFNKKQIEEVRGKIHAEKSETRATPKLVWNSGLRLSTAPPSLFRGHHRHRGPVARERFLDRGGSK